MPKILIVNSSCRKYSNSNLLSAAVAEGAIQKGHRVEILDISSLEIGPCRGCMGCRKLDARFCAIADGMSPLYPQIVEADAIIYVSPVYWFNLGGQIKQFIDRCFAVAMPRKDGSGGFARKKLGLVLAFEGDDPFDSGGINAIRCLQDICTYSGAAWGGAVYGTANQEGQMRSNAAALEKAKEFGANL